MRINKYNTTINTNYGETIVEFDIYWAIKNADWIVVNVDVIDFTNKDIVYDDVRSRILEIAYTDCDPHGGIYEEIDYVD